MSFNGRDVLTNKVGDGVTATAPRLVISGSSVVLKAYGRGTRGGFNANSASDVQTITATEPVRVAGATRMRWSCAGAGRGGSVFVAWVECVGKGGEAGVWGAHLDAHANSPGCAGRVVQRRVKQSAAMPTTGKRAGWTL